MTNSRVKKVAPVSAEKWKNGKRKFETCQNFDARHNNQILGEVELIYF